ncbi:MAG: hypothetical protein CMH21_11485 [Methylophaga sp.]|jgi:uncharacterized membrane protein|nr:hypothetical protein [Methylophaga sp.]MAY18340.1 hypothetical protein [Methylophaga sp.]HCD05807.1 hypothetical protein [Methylophaga sp.]|tara:strand:- start:9916 stop:10095 length:180 start_codon:yes stop_codon:yes gene_type:complete
MNYHRRKLLKSGLLGVIGISIFNIGILHFLRKSDIHITTIGKDSFLLNGWLITKNDLRD